MNPLQVCLDIVLLVGGEPGHDVAGVYGLDIKDGRMQLVRGEPDLEVAGVYGLDIKDEKGKTLYFTLYYQLVLSRKVLKENTFS